VKGRFDIPTAVAGIAIAALGVIVLLAVTAGLGLDLGWLAPLALAVVGLILLAGGLAGDGDA
jgi:hypothetical protein